MFYFSLIVDLAKFMTVLSLFLVGFTMLITAMNTPFYDTKQVDRSMESLFLVGFTILITAMNTPFYDTKQVDIYA